MTAVKPLTLELRYQVYADLNDGTKGYLVNSFTRPEVAKRAMLALMSGPGTFVEDAWIIDTQK